MSNFGGWGINAVILSRLKDKRKFNQLTQKVKVVIISYVLLLLIPLLVLIFLLF